MPFQKYCESKLSPGFLGDAFLFELMNFFERFIIKRIAKTTTSVERIEDEKIEGFVGKLTHIAAQNHKKS